MKIKHNALPVQQVSIVQVVPSQAQTNAKQDIIVIQVPTRLINLVSSAHLVTIVTKVPSYLQRVQMVSILQEALQWRATAQPVSLASTASDTFIHRK